MSNAVKQPYLHGWHHPDEIREYRRTHKTPEKTDKRTTLQTAVKAHVKNNDYIAFGGLGSVRNPMAAIYEIIRQHITGLTVAAKGSQHDWQVLAAAGAVSQAEVAYGFADEIRGLCPATRKKAESGELKVLSEMTNAGFQWRFSAAARGLSFFPTRTALGTDTFEYSGSTVIEDPYTNSPVELLPACYPDVAIIHVHRADQYGNCQIDGNTTVDLDLAHAAKRVIITTEEIVDHDVITCQPDQTKIPYFVVDAVVEAPFGAHPSQMPYSYSFDEEHWQEWLDASSSSESLEAYLTQYVFESATHEDYLEKIGGYKQLHYLKQIEKGLVAYPPPARRG